MESHIENELENNDALKEIREKQPTRTHKALSDYQKEYTQHYKKNEEVINAIEKNGIKLSDGQTSFHGGGFIFNNKKDINILQEPLSTSLSPEVALRNAEHKGKAFKENEINLSVIEIKNNNVNAFVFKHKGTLHGNEKEILINAGAKIKVIKRVKLDKKYIVSNGVEKKEVNAYVNVVEVS